jgi:amino acid transporter
MAYGDFAGFLIAWGYWISVWASLPVIGLAFATAIIDELPTVVPSLSDSDDWRRNTAIALTLGSIWLVVLVNLRGVKEAGLFSSITTYIKLVPFAAIALIGLFFIRPENLADFNPSGESLFAASAALAPLTMFAFLGLESATVPAGDVRDPERTIPRSTVLGISVAGILYVLGTVAVMGILPRAELVGSIAPFQDAARVMWGSIGAGAITLAVIISSLGALNGWALLMGQVPMAAAQDKLFPAVFGRLSSRGVPAVGIVLSALLATALILVIAVGGAGGQAFYDLVVSLSTMAAVVPYAFCSLAVGLIAIRGKDGGAKQRIGAIEIIAFVFSIFVLYGCGPEAVLYGFMLLVLGVPVYVWQRSRGAKT